MARHKVKVRTTLEEAPLDDLRRLKEEGHTQVLLYFRRQTTKGTFESLKSDVFPIDDLITDGLQKYLDDVYGGGSYIVEVRNISNHAEELCARYRIVIVGVPKSPAGSIGAPPSAVDLASSYRGLGFSPFSGVGSGGGNLRPSDLITHTPDAIALSQVQELREELRTLRKAAETREQRHSAEVEKLKTELVEARLQHERSQAEAREQRFQAEMAALRDRINQPAPKPAIDMGVVLSAVSAFVPVLTAVISTSRERQQMALDAQMRSAEQQQKAHEHSTQMMLGLLKKPDESKALLEVFLPKLLEANNPAKFMDIMATMGETQMQTVAMAVQGIQALMPESDSPGMAMIKTVLEGVGGIAEQWQEQQRQQQLQQQKQQKQLQQPTQQRVSARRPVQGNGAATEEHLAEPVETPRQAPRNARELAQQIIEHPQWPKNLRGRHWLNILTTLHSERPIDVIAQEVGTTLQGMYDSKSLDSVEIAAMFEDDGPKPSEVLMPIFAPLPIGQQRMGRLEKILEIIDALYEASEEPIEEEQPEEDGVEVEADLETMEPTLS